MPKFVENINSDTSNIYSLNRSIIVSILFLSLLLCALFGYLISLDPDWLHVGIESVEIENIFFLLPLLIVPVFIIKKPIYGLYFLVIIIYSNASEILIRFHGLPSLLQLLVPFLFLSVFLNYLFEKNSIKSSFDKVLILMGLYGLTIFASSFVSENTYLASQFLYDYIKIFLLVVVVISLLNSKEYLDRSIWLIMIVVGVMCSLSVFQVMTSSYENELLGFARIKLAFIAGDKWEPRITGPLSDPNFYAQILIVLIPISVYKLLDEKSLKLKIVSGYILFITLVAIFFTYSRGGILTLLVMVPFILFNRKFGIKKIALLILISASMVFLFAPKQLEKRLSTITQLFELGEDTGVKKIDSSFRQRLLFNKTAWEMFVDKPVLGVGAGNYPESFVSYAENIGITLVREQKVGVAKFPHNLYLQVAAETGLIGLIIFMSIIIISIKSFITAYKNFKKNNQDFYAGLVYSVMIGFIGYLFSSIFLHGEYMRYFWLVLAMGIAAKRISTLQLMPQTSKTLPYQNLNSE